MTKIDLSALALACTSLLIALHAGPVAAGEPSCRASDDPPAGAAVVMKLDGGDVLHATYTGCDGPFVLVDHALLGSLRIPRESISENLDAALWQQRLEAAADPAPEPAPQVAAPAAAVKGPWSSQLELGLNGSSGNAENYNLRAGLAAKRETSAAETAGDLTFVRAEAEDDGGALETTESKLLGNLRNDWLFPGSPWRYFALGSTDVDEFKDYDLRWSFATGPAYAFIDSERTKLIGRVGAGLSQELGGDDEGVVPEALIGAEWEQQISERQQLTAGAVIYPDLSDPAEFRSVAKAAWDLRLDPEVDLRLRLGLEDRYDSNPGTGTKSNDLDYYASLLYGF